MARKPLQNRDNPAWREVEALFAIAESTGDRTALRVARLRLWIVRYAERKARKAAKKSIKARSAS